MKETAGLLTRFGVWSFYPFRSYNKLVFLSSCIPIDYGKLITDLTQLVDKQSHEVADSRTELQTRAYEIKNLQQLCATKDSHLKDLREELQEAQDDRKALERQVANLKRLNRELEGKPAFLIPPRSPSTPGSCYSPRTRTNRLLRGSKLNPKKVSGTVKRALEMYYTTRVAMKGLQDARTDQVQPIFEAMLQEQVFVGSRLKTRFAQHLSLKRHTMSAAFYKRRQASIKIKRVNSRHVTTAQREAIVKFYMRGDNSRCTAGKKEYTIMKELPNIPEILDLVTGKAGKFKHKVQNFVLTDTIANIYEKYVFEAKGRIVSSSTFYAARLPFIRPVSFLKMRECLCTTHQNFAHLISSLRKNINATQPTCTFPCSPDEFVKNKTEEDVLSLLGLVGPGRVQFDMWAKELDPFLEKKRHQMLRHSLPRDDYIKYFQHEYREFKAHSERVHAQYTATKEIKDTLKPGELAIHMDFAESYSCRDGSSVTQCAHWNKSVVCIHPMVVYYHDRETKSTQHKTFVYLSHCDKKNSVMVFSILKKFFRIEFPTVMPTYDIQRVYYVTDGPTSQYRNKMIFWIIANHKRIFKCEGQWHYLEKGHGKGPCDGVGGSLKRDAYEATKQGKLVSNPATFYEWAKSRNRTRLHYAWVDAFDYAVTFYQRRKLVIECLKSVYGTFQLHAAVSSGNLHELAHRVTSCTCPLCRSGLTSSSCKYKYTSTLHPKSNPALVMALFCERCMSPLCVCVMKAAILREHYVYAGHLLQAPGIFCSYFVRSYLNGSMEVRQLMIEIFIFSEEKNASRASDDNDVDDGGDQMTGEGSRQTLTAAQKKKAAAAAKRAIRQGKPNMTHECRLLRTISIRTIY